MSKTYYLTTPIYYTSGSPHVGHAYCSIMADTLARFHRLIGDEVFFLTGTDEHGQKVEEKAQESGKSPQDYVDTIDLEFKALWKKLGISYDAYIRTTDQKHKLAVQKIFLKLYEQGDIYKKDYEGHYCVPCEAYWTDHQLDEEKNCPDCGRQVIWLKEESYFFKASKYADRLIEHIETNPKFIQPVSRANEMMNNFLKPGLQDISVTRTSVDWGIPVPFDPEHKIYVWIDALPNYITALGYTDEHDQLMQKFWPADLHLVGKEIIRFHTIIWPIILMALDLPLPKQIFGHGWLLFDNDKMSKSKGNVVDPVELIDQYGSDALRHYLLSKVPVGNDGNFTIDLFKQSYNTDLANDLGNLLSRTVAMQERYFQGVVQNCQELTEEDRSMSELARKTPEIVLSAMLVNDFNKALAAIWRLIDRSNKYIDENEPWVLARSEDKRERLGTVLYYLSENLRYIGVLLQPFMPETTPKIFRQLGLMGRTPLQTWQSLETYGRLPQGTVMVKEEALFPRIDLKNKKAEQNDRAKAQAGKKKEKDKGAAQKMETEKQEVETENILPELKPQITIDDFAKVDFRIAEIIACERVPKADRLLKLTVKIGETSRTIVSGIAEHYTPEELVGKQVCVVVNLAPHVFRGIKSEGMLLAASDDKDSKIIILEPEKRAESGWKVR
ncbi:MAG: methionine--tRNA ligase [Firmicutes bacterium]|jgi:methionyl-tRNA synthetase|nr:methionine--tRNA ligase [Bacillota bacterium]